MRTQEQAQEDLKHHMAQAIDAAHDADKNQLAEKLEGLYSEAEEQ